MPSCNTLDSKGSYRTHFLGAPPKERGAPLILWFGGMGGGGGGGEDISFFE